MSGGLVEDLALHREVRALQSDLDAVSAQLAVARAERDRAVALVKMLLMPASVGAEQGHEDVEVAAAFVRWVNEAAAFVAALRG